MSKVDLSNYAGREQAYVKHCLLEGYLPEWAYKVGSKWDSLVYVDAFAGPWQTTHPNYADSSFGIAVDALRRCQLGLTEGRGRDLHMECVLVEQDENAFAHLEKFATAESRPNFVVHALPSYRKLFGRPGVVEVLRNTPPDERVERAVQEYSLSLKLLCNFKYVSSAVILEPNEEAVRYYLVYATNHPRGVEVFKAAENKAARIQDKVRQESRVRKTGGQLEFPSDDGPPKSRLILDLLQRYVRNARANVLNVLRANTAAGGVAYADLFCEAMAFPLVTPNDLVEWLKALEPNIKVNLAGVSSRKKPKPSEDYRVVVINSKALK